MAKVSLRAYNREIETMIDRGQLDEAIAHCFHILKTFPKHLETYRLLGKAYLEYKRYKDAVDIFTRVLVAVPNDFVANVGMSIIRDEEGKLDDAIWHMERAFEVQPSNPAIQSELQRLYGRRDGVQPPRIRMTRGALAHMYVQGELYPQAISEIKGVLKEDPGRRDMQALLARAHFRSGQKNEAAEVASALLRIYPHCLDANRVLAEILSVDKLENAQVYRQRVLELDPYAAHVSGSLFHADEAPDAAVSLDHLDWNGQPVGAAAQADWRDSRAISLEGGIDRGREEQPDWLKNASKETSPTVPPHPSFASAFETSTPPAQPTPADDLPDFLREAGWGKSTGAFDESKSAFAEEGPAAEAQPIAQGELPDWIKEMAPKPEAEPAAEEELPDWINQIGPASVAAASAGAVTEDLDWLKQLDQPSQPAAGEQPSEEKPDWLKQFEAPATSAPAPQEPDWLKDIGQESQPAPAQPASEELDWLKGLGGETPAAPQTEEPDWLKQFDAQSETAAPASGLDELEFLKELTSELPQTAPEPAQPSTIDAASLGKSEKEQDDSFAWLEALAAKQGASEGLLTKPEERLEQEPDWVKQVKDLGGQPPVQPPAEPVASISSAEDTAAWLRSLDEEETQPEPKPEADETAVWLKGLDETPPAAEEPAPVEPSAVGVDDLGKSEKERDDSFAWLEALAAKQGASEGLLTKPEERLEQEPEWIKKVKTTTGQLTEQTPSESAARQEEIPAPEPTPVEPPVNVEELGKSEKERDDSFAWLEAHAAKQGASEGLLTKPEERLEQEPEWVKKVKTTTGQLVEKKPEETVAPHTEEPAIEPMPAGESVSRDNTAAWLRGLDEEKTVPEPAADETAMWLKSLDETKDEARATPAPAEELPSWMQAIEEEKPAPTEPAIPAVEVGESAWMKSLEEPVAESASKADEEELPSWLSGLEKEEPREEIPVPAAKDELPSWLRDETGEVVAEPVKIEPTRPTDWQPVAEKEPEPAPEKMPAPPVVEPEPEPPVMVRPVEKTVQEKPKPRPAKKASPAEPKPDYREPVTIRGTGMLTTPIDLILHTARTELSRSNIPGALETYGKLIKKGRFLDEVIFDLREALYRYPVEVSIWQSLGDAYMRANRLQDALDAYTKAEELLR